MFLRRIGGRGHFRSRDKDGGHTIRSAIAEKPMLYANFTTPSFIEPELLPIEVLHCGNREFRVFLRKIVDIIKMFGSHPKNDVAVAKTHFPTVLACIIPELHAFKMLFYAESVGVVTFGSKSAI